MSGGAYTRKTKLHVLVSRTASVPYRSTYAVESRYIPTLVAVPLSRVLRPLPCDSCRREIERDEYVLRERHADYFVTTCDLCASWLTLEDIFPGLAAQENKA